MKSLKNFDVEIFRLSDGNHEFDYELNDSFFASIEGSFIEKGNLKVKVTIEKSERLLLTRFNIKGDVELTCDRSLDNYNHIIDNENELVFKFGDEFQEVSEDVIIIPHDTQKLNLAQYIYEYIGLAIPMKKLHPRFQNEEEEDDETEVKLVYRSDEEKNKEVDDAADPRWNALKDLKNKLK